VHLADIIIPFGKHLYSRDFIALKVDFL